MSLTTSIELRPDVAWRNARLEQRRGDVSPDLLVLRALSDANDLSAAQASDVREWAAAARRRYPNGVVVMAATRVALPANRFDLLRALCDEIAPLCFIPERVRYSVDPLPSWTDEPVVALKVISSAQVELEVRSICSLLADAGRQGSDACSSAS